MGDLTRNFSKHEFACPEHFTFDFPLDLTLVEGLQEVRDRLEVPVFITSGFRTVDYNKKIGGSPKSQHLLGKAADIIVPNRDLKEVIYEVFRVKQFYCGGVGVYPNDNFIHVDVRGYRARWQGSALGEMTYYYIKLEPKQFTEGNPCV